MATSRGRSLIPRTHPRLAELASYLAWMVFVAITFLGGVHLGFAEVTTEFRRTFTVTSAEVATLDIDVPNGDIKILYGRDGQVSISAFASASADAKLDDNFFPTVVRVEQIGNHLTIGHAPNSAYPVEGIKVSYRIDVPYRTEVTSRLIRGTQNISGILGPVKAVTAKGNITAAYISDGLQAQVGIGNVELEVIGAHVEAKTGSGNISCERLPQGVSAETGEGDITLMVVGPSTAVVTKGSGRIDVGGARGALVASTDAGDLHVKAIPHEDWQLRSASGGIRLELPPVAKVDLEVSTGMGQLQIDRDDIASPEADVREIHQTLNGGGKRIVARTESGKIAIR